MSERPPLVTPFRGERYAAASRLSDFLAPPYDVISAEARGRYAARDPHNIVHVMLPEAAPDADRYAGAARLLAQWRADGVFRADTEPSVYVLAQEFSLPSGGGRRTRLGFFSALRAEPYATRRVRPHEKTHKGPKADRLALLKATQTNLESIFLLSPDEDGALARALSGIAARKPDAQAELDGVKLRLWVVTGPAAPVVADLAAREPLYIADGHHRYETAVAFARDNPAADRVLAFIVSARDLGLVVLPTHRVVFGSQPSADRMLQHWRRWFDTEVLPAGTDPMARVAELGRATTACAVAWPNGEVMTLALKENTSFDGVGDLEGSPVVRTLDVARVETLVVKPLLGAGRRTPTLVYSADASEALEMVRAGNAVATVLVNPTKVEQVFAVADAGEHMPPKSTYFVPKVPSGMVIRTIIP